MTDIFLHNTLTGEKEKFIPIKKGEVTMYNCGPTVYDYVHIGNLRAYIFADTLRRMFEFNGYKVHQVINVTDIGHLSSDADDGEDKMTKALKREGKPLTLPAMREVANFYFEKFKDDLKALNIETPEHFPFASDHIEEDKTLIQTLTDKGFTYKTSDGIYFDTSKDASYGKLGQVVKEDGQSRIGENSEKKNQKDFALWKFNKELGYKAPWGNGFPGWHIECSAMSMKYLGETFDIHTGGIDHIPVHHNNEIAQSESATGKEFAHYWMHSAFLNTGDVKMAKSAGNFIRLIDLEVTPLAYRLLLLQSHYKTQMSFGNESLGAAKETLSNLYKQLSSLPKSGSVNSNFIETFTEEINNDLNTPRALALLFEVLKSDINDGSKLATILKMDEVLGLKIKEAIIPEKIPEEVKKITDEREEARKNKDFKKSDELREKISEMGYAVEDTENGPRVNKK